MSTDLLTVRDLTVSYSDHYAAAVRHVSLSLKRGEFHGLAVREMVNLGQKQPIGSTDDARADCDQECWGF